MQDSFQPEITFESIVKTHQEKVRNICFRFARNREDADDLAQEVFIQVYESLAHFRKESSISTWIYRIAVNKSLDFLRKKKRKKRFTQLTSLFGFGHEQEGEIVIPSEDNPHRNPEARERKEILDNAIDKLPENQKKQLCSVNTRDLAIRKLQKLWTYRYLRLRHCFIVPKKICMISFIKFLSARFEINRRPM